MYRASQKDGQLVKKWAQDNVVFVSDDFRDAAAGVGPFNFLSVYYIFHAHTLVGYILC